MPLTTTNWNATQTSLEVIQAYTDAAIVPDNAFIKAVGREAQTLFPSISARTATNAADGSAALTIGSTTETAVTLQPDSPLKVWEYIPYSNINTSPVNFISAYTQRLGADLRDAHDRRIINLVMKTAAAVAAGAQEIIFDNEGTGSAVAGALKDTVVYMDLAKIPQDNRFLFLRPTEMGKLFDIASIRSGDFITGADNKNNLTRLMFMGLNCISYNGWFNTDTSALSGLAAKYQFNAASATQPYVGAAWQRNALAIQYFEEVNVKSSNQDVYESMLVTARLQMGTAVLRTSSMVTLRGDV